MGLAERPALENEKAESSWIIIVVMYPAADRAIAWAIHEVSIGLGVTP